MQHHLVAHPPRGQVGHNLRQFQRWRQRWPRAGASGQQQHGRGGNRPGPRRQPPPPASTADPVFPNIHPTKGYRIHRTVGLDKSQSIANLCASALKSGAKVILSEDMNSGQTIAGIQIENPFI
jgi:hypothetical protein